MQSSNKKVFKYNDDDNNNKTSTGHDRELPEKQTGTVKFDQLPKEDVGRVKENWESKQNG